MQSSFLQKRQKLLKAWRIAGPILLLTIVALAIYFYFSTPLIINPLEVAARLESKDMDFSTLQTMAILLPVMVLIVFFLMLIFIVLMYAAFANEKKYLKIIEECENQEIT